MSINLLLSIAVNGNSIFSFMGALIGVFLISVFFLFKLSVAPFHFWFPQVYDGSPISSTIIFLLLPKFIILSVFIRWLLAVSYLSLMLKSVLLWSGVYSTVMGTFLALQQGKLKKLFIYSSIGQLGLPVAVLSVFSYTSVINSYTFIVIYILTNVVLWGIFLTVHAFSKAQTRVSGFGSEYPIFLTVLSNLFYWNRVWVFSLTVVFFSMSGIPPLSGFLAKVLLYFELLYSQNFIASIFLILMGAIGTFYYLKILKIGFFENKFSRFAGQQFTLYETPLLGLDLAIHAFLLFSVISLGVFPDGLILSSNIAVIGLSLV